MSGHIEPLAVAPLMLAVLGGISAWKRGLLVGLASGIKMVPLWLAPSLGGRKPYFWIALIAVVIVGYLPFVSAGAGTVESIGTFGRRWEGNAGGLAVIKGGVEWAASSASGGAEMVRVPLLDGPARGLNGTFFSLHKDSAMDAAAPGTFPVDDFVLAVSKAIAGALFALVFAWTWFRRFEPIDAGLWLFGAFLVLTPVLHPWYVIWVLPFAALRGAWPWFVFAAFTPLAYLPREGWWREGVWQPAGWIPWVEWGSLALAALLYALRGKLARVRLVDRVLLK